MAKTDLERRQATIELAEQILDDIELQSATLSVVVLKCARLARLLGDTLTHQLFLYEAGGYPNVGGTVPSEAFELGRKAGRVSQSEKDGEVTETMNTLSIEQTENTIAALQTALAAASDPNISLHSSNPSQILWAPKGNLDERTNRTVGIRNHSQTLGKTRTLAYDYASNCLHELEFSDTASEIFERTRSEIDQKIVLHLGHGIQKTAAISANLQSTNSEDWANAVHSCRRLLEELADALMPPQTDVVKDGRTIRMGAGNYINRLIAFIEGRSESKTFQSVVGSTLSFVGERLDAIFSASQKGSHSTINSQQEAERYVIYTFMTVGDILALLPEDTR